MHEAWAKTASAFRRSVRPSVKSVIATPMVPFKSRLTCCTVASSFCHRSSLWGGVPRMRADGAADAEDEDACPLPYTESRKTAQTNTTDFTIRGGLYITLRY